MQVEVYMALTPKDLGVFHKDRMVGCLLKQVQLHNRISILLSGCFTHFFKETVLSFFSGLISFKELLKAKAMV